MEKDGKKIYHVQTDWKQASDDTLISYRINFKKININRTKEKYLIKVKELITQEYITILNLNASSSTSSQFIEKLTKLNRKSHTHSEI